jgi:hypothetical protein
MSAQQSQQSQQELAVQFLAKESHVPIEEVRRLYGSEMAKLEVGARVRVFLPIFAIRKVRERLS